MPISHHKSASKMSNGTLKANGKKARNTSVELLRLAAMLMIVMSHIYASQSGEEYSGALQIVFLFVSTIFHSGLGIIIFMLVSGYYMINLSLKKLTSFVSVCWVSALCSLALKLVIYPMAGDSVGMKAILRHLIPISSRYYWYISCYFCLLVLSPFINKLIDKLDKKSFTYLVLTLCAVFFVMPTFLYFDIMNDAGKGIVTMVSTYIIGAYLSKHATGISKKKLWIALIIVVVITFAGNIAATLVRGETSYPFSRECTITTLLIGVILLLIATKSEFVIKPINSIASNTLYMYIIGCSATGCIAKLDLLKDFNATLIKLPICLGISTAVLLGCYVLSIILRYPAKLISSIMNGVINKATQILLKNKKVKALYEGINS